MNHIPPVDFKDTVEKVIDDLETQVTRLKAVLYAKDQELATKERELQE